MSGKGVVSVFGARLGEALSAGVQKAAREVERSPPARAVVAIGRLGFGMLQQQRAAERGASAQEMAEVTAQALTDAGRIVKGRGDRDGEGT